MIGIFFEVYNRVKGGIELKKIKLKFAGLGYQNYCQAEVSLYDKSGCCVGCGTTYNGNISFYVKEKYLYKVVANSCGEMINSCFYVSDCNTYFFAFSRAYVCNIESRNRRITFLLTDSNYLNLPIEKGEIIVG